MFNILISPKKNEWHTLAQRPEEDKTVLKKAVRNIITQIKTEGDEALIRLTEQFDNIRISGFKISQSVIDELAQKIPSRLKDAIDQAYENIKAFHTAQKLSDVTIQTMPGVGCSLTYKPLNSVGLYIPGGQAPLFSTVLMLGIPAQIAGCNNIVLCTPPNEGGKIHPAICYAAQKCGINNIYTVGGAQAIAAMAFGTTSIPKTDKIFGPGNQYVTMAKQLVNLEGIAIDIPAGPSELAVFADQTAVPEFIAADLLSQAEHAPDSQVVLVTTDEEILKEVQFSLRQQLEQLPRKEIASQALKHCRAIYFEETQEAFEFLNFYAPEHLIIASDNADDYVDYIENAGSVFLGNLTPEAAGDYASGTNHTLPTNGAARAFSGITLSSFMKTITYQKITEEGVRHLAPIVEMMAEHEQLDGHKRAMQIRRESL